jgi:hypothetical protein
MIAKKSNHAGGVRRGFETMPAGPGCAAETVLMPPTLSEILASSIVMQPWVNMPSKISHPFSVCGPFHFTDGGVRDLGEKGG